MLSEAQVTSASTRLDGTKLKPIDVSKLVSAFRMFFGGLEQKYGYQFQAKLEELDDSTNNDKIASQVAAALIVMETEGFGVSGFSGSGSGMFYKEEDEYLKYVLFAFSKIYPVPVEFSKFPIGRYSLTSRKESSTILTERIP